MRKSYLALIITFASVSLAGLVVIYGLVDVTQMIVPNPLSPPPYYSLVGGESIQHATTDADDLTASAVSRTAPEIHRADLRSHSSTIKVSSTRDNGTYTIWNKFVK